MAPVQLSAAPVRPEGPAWVRWGALGAVCLVYFALTMDFIAVAVALPAIQRPLAQGGLGASFSQLEWALEAFVVAVAALVLVAGYLADVLGKPLVFLAGTWVFAFSSFSASLTSSPYALIASRLGQGVGAALVLATAPLLLSDMFGRKESRAALAAWATVTAFAVAASPAVGGVATEVLGWRWIFGFEAVAAGLAFVGAQATMGRYLTSAVPGLGEPTFPDGRRGGGDWKGVGLFTAAVAIAVVGLVRTTSTPGEWAESGVLACFACSALLFGSFVAVECVAPAPVLDMSLFRERTFSAASAAALGLSGAVLGPLFLLVLYFSHDLAKSPLQAGLALALLTGMTVPVLALGGWLERWFQPKWLICGGLFLVSGGFWLLSRSLSAPSPRGVGLGALAPGLLVAGAGLELVSPRLALAAASAVKPALVAQASRASSTFRHLGTALGVAVAGSVFVSRLSSELSRSLSLAEGPPTASLVLQGKLAQAAKGATGGPVAGLAAVHESSAYALRGVFVVASLVALGSALASLALRAADLARLVGPAPPPQRAAPVVVTSATVPLPLTRAGTRTASSVAAALARSQASRHASLLLSARSGRVTKLARPEGPAGNVPSLGHVYGAVNSYGGAWVPEVKVVLRDALGTSVASTESDSAGSYHFSDVPAGHYTLAAIAGCNGSQEGAERAEREVEVAAGKATVADLCLPPTPGELLPDKGPSLVGSWKVPARDAWVPEATTPGNS
jgi:hypothetical protein